MSTVARKLSSLNAIYDFALVCKRQKANGSEDFTSDGSNAPSKQCTGTMYMIGQSKTGLKRYVCELLGAKTRKSNLRMPAHRAAEILDYIFTNNYVQCTDGTWVHRKNYTVDCM